MSTQTLYDILSCEVQKMVVGIGKGRHGNIYPLILREIERYIIQQVLIATDYNYSNAAKMLGIGRSTLYRRMQSLEIVAQKKPTMKKGP